MTASFQSLRMPLILPLAAIVTVGLFLMMRQLIDTGPARPVAEVEPPAVVIRFEPIDAEIDRSPDIIHVEPVAPPPARPATDAPTSPVDALPGSGGHVVAPVGRSEISGPGSIVITQREPVPVVRVQPMYPPRAAERRLEGQCSVLFDITPQGTTTNVRALDCTSSLFERASVNAVANWRYSPQIEAGQPTMYRGATTQLVFRLDE
ncbi:energy transducer TonB [Maricaulis sp.]|uniref:energy transducer TonB n=1 Tax=Maricaulis sp. TaxID=1486257 RepID=UPI003A933954